MSVWLAFHIGKGNATDTVYLRYYESRDAELRQAYDNLTFTQDRCTKLLGENRALKRKN